MTSYKWLEIASTSDYDQLQGMLDEDYAPSWVIGQLKEGISLQVSRVLIEYDYVDKDYRSTYYNFYSKKGREYRSNCVRLHFFDSGVSFDEKSSDLKWTLTKLQSHYFGYMILRPTLLNTIGRSCLTPDVRIGADDSRIITAGHNVHVLGYELSVTGFPSMDQHSDISVCAHAACWSILRHYSETYSKYRELLVYDITQMAHQFDPGGLVPANGLDAYEAERVFQAAGTYPLVIAKDKSAPDLFYRQMLAYLESGFPLYFSKLGHAVAAVGHSWSTSSNTVSTASDHAWDQVDRLVVVDDNYLPYRIVPRSKQTGIEDIVNDYGYFIVPLPDKIFYSAEAVEFKSVELGKLLAKFFSMPKAGDLVRRYFLTTIADFRQWIRPIQSQFGDKLVRAIMELRTAQYVWVVEYASSDQWKRNVVAARAILDATASLHETNPVWFAHGHGAALFFDRSVKASGSSVKLVDVPGVEFSRWDRNSRTRTTAP